MEVHHIRDFSNYPLDELKYSNLMTLCRTGGKHGIKSCHFFVGHSGDWKKINENVEIDVIYWNRKFRKEAK